MQIYKELYEYRHMIFSLVKKDLRGRYKASVLGFLWTFINPLLQMAVYSFVFSTIMRVTNVDKYYLFLFVALIPWIFFSSSITVGSTSVISSKNMITKIYFPREVIPVSYVTSSFVNMLLCFIVIFLVIFISGVGVNAAALMWLPIVMIIEYLLALGFGLMVSAITVYFRDLQHILGILMMAWMYLTPIVYNADNIPQKWRGLINLNPMCHIITAYRNILYYKIVPNGKALLFTGYVSVLIMTLGFAVFDKLKKRFAETL